MLALVWSSAVSAFQENLGKNERRAGISLALIYAFRMLGLFMVMPVFALYAEQLPEATPLLAGLALGIYGLTQALLQIPFGLLSDRIGRTRTLLLMMSFQAVVILSLLLIPETQAYLLVLAATLIGFNYGTNLSLFPSATKDYFGLQNFGVNYGLVFSAWGAAGFILPRISQMLVAYTGTAKTSYILAAILLILAAMMAVRTRAPEKPVAKDRPVEALAPGLVYSGYRVHCGP